MGEQALPKVTEEAFVEREGVIRVADMTNAARCIWRETLMRDVGIDGQIEYVDAEGQAMGRFIAVQVKSGESYFAGSDRHRVTYSPAEKHCRYWERSPIPVVLVLYDPTTGELVWTDARAAIRDGRDDPIEILRANVFDADGVLEALRSEGPLPTGVLDPAVLIESMLAEEIRLDGCTLSFFDVFFQGLTDALCGTSTSGLTCSWRQRASRPLCSAREAESASTLRSSTSSTGMCPS